MVWVLLMKFWIYQCKTLCFVCKLKVWAYFPPMQCHISFSRSIPPFGDLSSSGIALLSQAAYLLVSSLKGELCTRCRFTTLPGNSGHLCRSALSASHFTLMSPTLPTRIFPPTSPSERRTMCSLAEEWGLLCRTHNGAFASSCCSVLTPTIWGNRSKTRLVMMNLNANGNLTGGNKLHPSIG